MRAARFPTTTSASTRCSAKRCSSREASVANSNSPRGASGVALRLRQPTVARRSPQMLRQPAPMTTMIFTSSCVRSSNAHSLLQSPLLASSLTCIWFRLLLSAQLMATPLICPGPWRGCLTCHWRDLRGVGRGRESLMCESNSDRCTGVLVRGTHSPASVTRTGRPCHQCTAIPVARFLILSSPGCGRLRGSARGRASVPRRGPAPGAGSAAGAFHTV